MSNPTNTAGRDSNHVRVAQTRQAEAGVRRLAFVDVLSSLWRRRGLVVEMTNREFGERYGSHAIGFLWVAILPVMTAAAYVLVFGFVFKSRIVTPDPTAGNYVVFLLAGLAPWLAISDMVGRASFAISGSPGFVKQMIFPLEVLPVKLVGPALATQFFLTLVLIGYALYVGHPFTLMWAFWPFALICELLVAVGFTYLIAAVSVFVRDVRDIVTLYFTIGLFLSPILYQLDGVPNVLKYSAMLNPVTPVVLVFRDIVVNGAITTPWAWIAAPVLGVVALHVGYRSFRNLRPLMGDML